MRTSPQDGSQSPGHSESRLRASRGDHWPPVCPHPPVAAGTYTLLCNCHWQLLDFDSLRGAPPQGKARGTDCHTSVRAVFQRHTSSKKALFSPVWPSKNRKAWHSLQISGGILQYGLTNVTKPVIMVVFGWKNQIALFTILKRKRTDRKCIKSCVKRS